MQKFGIICGILIISTLQGCRSLSKHTTIEASTSYCYGSCPVLDLKLSKGVLFYNLIDNTKLNGFYKYNLNTKELKKLDSLMLSVNFESLKEEYVAEIQDMQIINTRILKGGKLLKSIYYYNGEAPKEYEKLIDYMISLKSRKLEKIDTVIKFNTRDKVKPRKMPIPPLPQ